MSRLRAGAALLALFGFTAPALGQVDVQFVEPQRYTDAASRSGGSPTLRATLFEIRRVLESYGASALRPGESLSIAVLDIDLAGLDQPMANPPFGMRVVTDVTPPGFRLRYVFKSGGRVVLSATETVSQPFFLSRYGPGTGATSFRYEREVLRDWLQARFVARRPAGG